MMRKPERKLFTWMNIRMITGEEKETGTTWVNWRKMLVTLLPHFLEINIKKGRFAELAAIVHNSYSRC